MIMTKDQVLQYCGIPQNQWDNYKVVYHCERSVGSCKDMYTIEKVEQ